MAFIAKDCRSFTRLLASGVVRVIGSAGSSGRSQDRRRVCMELAGDSSTMGYGKRSAR